ncbi:ROK family protein [bacterium]|nr:ROK family protein [bacterium]
MNNSQEKTVIGVDLGGTKVQVGRISRNQIEQEYYRLISAKEEKEKIIREVIEAIDTVFDKSVDSIGVGVPGVVDIKSGIVYDLVNIPSWKKVHLKERLEDHFGCPVFINNDANCFAVGEKYFGKARNFSNIVGLITGTGLGAGIIVNNSLYNGSNCGAGEFGMIAYRDRNYEYYCSGQFFREIHKIDGADLFRRAENGDGSALEIFRQYGYHIGQLITTILYAIDPEIIIFGGSVSKSFPFYIDELRKVIRDFPYSSVRENIIIDVSETVNIAVLGAASLCYNIDVK